MTLARQRAFALALAAVGGLLIGAAADRWAPPPAADVPRGSEEAFAEGLEWRELPLGKPPRRWTKPRAWFTFRDLPPGPATLEVRVHGHEGPVTVAANGVVAGAIATGARAGVYEIDAVERSPLSVELRTDGFAARDGRILGTQLDRVVVRPSPTPHVRASVVIPFVLLATLAASCGLASGLSAAAAAVTGAAIAGFAAAALWPCGLLRSPYAERLWLLLLACSALAGAFARLSSRREPQAAPWAFASVLLALIVQGALATSPLLVTSDASFHAHNLLDVSRGELFLTSITPHDRPFRIPYGISFYAVLVPFLPTRVEPVTLVRWGAAASGVVASAALFLLLLKRSPRVAGLAVILLQLLPASFLYYSEGTLSNVFGQSVAALFFVWWAGGTPLGAGLGALLLSVGALAHLSSLIVLFLLCAWLLALRREDRPLHGARAWALAAGFAVAAAYYATFLGLIVDQLPRLLEGAGEGGAAPLGPWGALSSQLRSAVAGWGLPAMALAWLGRPRSLAPGLDRDLAAFWLSGAALFGLALVSPLEARYVYALTLPVCVAAAEGLVALWDAGGGRRVAAMALGLAQAGLAIRGIVEGLLVRYRP